MAIFGWRWWDLGKDGSLRSVNNVIWPPNDPVEAECLFSDSHGGRHPGVGPPVFECGCGMWAYYDPEIASGLPHVNGYLRNTKAFGCIEAWGDIVEHELGFRAQFAIPRGVWVIRGRLHDAYEVQRFPNLAELVKVWDDSGGDGE